MVLILDFGYLSNKNVALDFAMPEITPKLAWHENQAKT